MAASAACDAAADDPYCAVVASAQTQPRLARGNVRVPDSRVWRGLLGSLLGRAATGRSGDYHGRGPGAHCRGNASRRYRSEQGITPKQQRALACDVAKSQPLAAADASSRQPYAKHAVLR